ADFLHARPVEDGLAQVEAGVPAIGIAHRVDAGDDLHAAVVLEVDLVTGGVGLGEQCVAAVDRDLRQVGGAGLRAGFRRGSEVAFGDGDLGVVLLRRTIDGGQGGGAGLRAGFRRG